LKNLLKLFDENETKMCEALMADLRKPRQESVCMEIEYLRNDIRGCLNNVADWVKDTQVEKNIVTIMDSTYLTMDPLGVVLIIGAWNYPIQISLGPLAGAISAGNCVVIKPSEMASASAELMAELIPLYMDPDCINVVTGGVTETTDLLNQQFDYIFFTGGGRIGKIVREASNKFLTPVTLELGGKSPVYIDSTADMDITAKRLMWAKYTNLGQTCIAPDYILCTEQVADDFIAKSKVILKERYGTDPQTSPDLCRIINKGHWERLNNLLSTCNGKVVVGGEVDPDDLYIAPTIITDVDPEAEIMQHEIFGPLFPILTVKDRKEAVEFINKRDKPLSLYVFSTDKETQEDFKRNTSSGSMVFNDAIVHLSIETLPFGGVGPSGMGSYHGKYTFNTFSHQKAVLGRDFNPIGEYLGEGRYAPYHEWKINRLGLLLKNRKIPKFLGLLPYLACILLGASGVLLIQMLINKFGVGSG